MVWLGWVRFVSARQVHGHCDVDVFTENDLVPDEYYKYHAFMIKIKGTKAHKKTPRIF